MMTVNVGFINSNKELDETQLDVKSANYLETEVVDLINIILSLKEEMDIVEVEYIECFEEEE